jgi:nitrite reductase/ring-hydroxylating ferredoxin subunit
VFGQGVGVNQTAFEGGPEAWTPIGNLDDLQERIATRRRVGDVDVMLYRDRDRVRAIADRCGHRGCSLSEGEIDGTTVTCACHGSVFRLADGEVLQGPATGPQTAFETRTRDGVVEIREERHSFTSSGLR